MTIKSFRCAEKQAHYEGQRARRFKNFEAVAERKLQMLDAAEELRDLQLPPGNRLEHLSGNREGQHSIELMISGAFVLFGRMLALSQLKLWTIT